MKITKKNIEDIIKLRKDGLSYSKISRKLDIDMQAVMYHLSKKYRDRIIKSSKQYQKNHKKQHNKYMREYMKKRYHEDEEYRESRKEDERQRRNTAKQKQKGNKGHPYKKSGRKK